MQKVTRFTSADYIIFFTLSFLILLSVLVLRSFAPSIFPQYFLFILLGYISFFIFLQVDFDILTLFSKHLYIASIALLILPLIIGQVTRGAIRWIPLGPITLQSSEVVRPFLLLYFSHFVTTHKINLENVLKGIFLVSLPFLLIFVQPSLGVAILTVVGFVGVILASPLDKKKLLLGASSILVLIPILWLVLAPYQKLRIMSFLNPESDPLGGGYHSIQSMIAVGSGRLFGRGLGEGVQTQLAFLPEKHTDFIFAAIAEELGLVGAFLLLVGLFIIFWRLIKIIENAESPTARAYVTGFFLTLFAETAIHVGMNMGLLPITGVPLPLVSAGGSALMATMVGLAIATNAVKT